MVFFQARSLSPPRMPDILSVKKKNEKTSETIRSFKVQNNFFIFISHIIVF
jgi:hypothetical protein